MIKKFGKEMKYTCFAYTGNLCGKSALRKVLCEVLCYFNLRNLMNYSGNVEQVANNYR